MRIDAETKQEFNASGLKIAVIISNYNFSIGENLLNSCVRQLKKAKAEIEIIRVPGALEIAFTASKLAKQKTFDAVVALGVVIKGETLHFEIVSFESHRALMDISLKYEIPIIFGIICANNEKQALDRASSDKMDKGKEFAIAAIEMAQINNQKLHDQINQNRRHPK